MSDEINTQQQTQPVTTSTPPSGGSGEQEG